MLISNLINNNYVAAIDDNGDEVVVKGTGIGYKARKGDYISESRIERIYRLNNQTSVEALRGLMQNIPEDHFQICSDIIDFARKKLNFNLNPNLYITLTDHINYALLRFSKGIQVPNPMVNDIKIFYPEEFAVAKHAIAYIHKKLGVQFGEEEAGFIAFHFVNAKADIEVHTSLKVTRLIKPAVEIIENYLNIHLETSTISFTRLTSHLQLIAKNVLTNSHNFSRPDAFTHTIKEAFPEEMACAKKIADYILKEFDYTLDEDELAYLSVNISRVRTQNHERIEFDV